MKRNPRDHGYGDSPQVGGPPKVLDRVPGGRCSNCLCETVFGIEVEVLNPPPQLRRPTEPHKVIGTYIGCPACPWASPMMTITRLLPPTEPT